MRNAKWNLYLPISEARRNDEVISLADSQVLRWIDEINGVVDADAMARDIKSHIRKIRRQENSAQNKRNIKKLYEELDKLQYKPDYMCLIIDEKKDYFRACKGFKINGISYKRLLGTNGGIKNSTIVFVSERCYDELRRRIENDRQPDKPIVPAKLEAYKALTCSASSPVSSPNGVLVVNDCMVSFESDVIRITDEGCDEPEMESMTTSVSMDASDGYGLMMPSLAERWSLELGLDYVVSGLNTRFSFEKGMVFTFDFNEFASDVAGSYIVRDAWGNDVDVRDVELILTTSMVKLWDSYSSCDDYLEKSYSNGYTFGIAKVCPRELEHERNLNYQFIQSYDLTDKDIDELIEPTVTEIKDVLGGDWRKAVLFLCGSGLNEEKVSRLDDDWVKALMIDRRALNDPYVQSSIFNLIRGRIKDAKVGVLKVHGNYSIVSGDPYALLQSVFGLEVTGLLGAGEIYNKYWCDLGADSLACFRAPMTCHNNIRLVHPTKSSEACYWYRYMDTCTIFNAWDTATFALNGCDYDGDLVLLTDNNVLVNKLNPLPALMCIQRNATKIVPTEEDFIRSNIASFGNEIGQTTNWITSMFEVMSKFDPGSKEYETLQYRIRCGQLFQQNSIDKAKGIICKPMPKSWHDRHSISGIEDDNERSFYRSIVADKKPYFMRYIYPQLMKQYNTYINNTNKNSLREFGITIDELSSIPEEDRTERQSEFLTYYNRRMPVGTSDCVMNRICRRIEQEFDGFISKKAPDEPFDYRFMRFECDYSAAQFYQIKRLYEEYNSRMSEYSILADYERNDECSISSKIMELNYEFSSECAKVCANRDALCNIVLDLCYKRSATKKFAWSMCGSDIVRNLLAQNNGIASFPELARKGEEADFRFGSNGFIVSSVNMGGLYECCAE